MPNVWPTSPLPLIDTLGTQVGAAFVRYNIFGGFILRRFYCFMEFDLRKECPSRRTRDLVAQAYSLARFAYLFAPVRMRDKGATSGVVAGTATISVITSSFAISSVALDRENPRVHRYLLEVLVVLDRWGNIPEVVNEVTEENLLRASIDATVGNGSSMTGDNHVTPMLFRLRIACIVRGTARV